MAQRRSEAGFRGTLSVYPGEPTDPGGLHRRRDEPTKRTMSTWALG